MVRVSVHDDGLPFRRAPRDGAHGAGRIGREHLRLRLFLIPLDHLGQLGVRRDGLRLPKRQCMIEAELHLPDGHASAPSRGLPGGSARTHSEVKYFNIKNLAWLWAQSLANLSRARIPC